MIFRRFFQNKFLFYLLLISFIASLFFLNQSKPFYTVTEQKIFREQHMNVQKELSNKLSQMDFENYLLNHGQEEYEYINKDKKEVQKIEDLMKLHKIYSSILSSFSFEGQEANGPVEAIPPKEMNKKGFLKGQQELVNLYRERYYEDLFDENYMEFVEDRLSFIKENDLEFIDENQNLMNKTLSRRSHLIFSWPVIIILAFVLSFSLDTEEISYYLKEDLILLKIKQFLFLILSVLLFIIIFLIFSGIFFAIFGDGIGSFNYYYYNPQEILGKTTYIFEKTGTILLYRGVLFTIFTTILSALFHVLFKLFDKVLFKILGIVASFTIIYFLFRNNVGDSFSAFELLKEFSFSTLTIKNSLILIVSLFGTLLLLLSTLYFERKNSSLQKSKKSTTIPFIIFYYIKRDFGRYSLYLLMAGFIIVSFLYSKNRNNQSSFEDYYKENYLYVKEQYEESKENLENHHDIFNQRNNVTDEIRESLPKKDQEELDYYEDGERKELTNDLKEKITIRNRYAAFENRGTDSQEFFEKEKDIIKICPYFLYHPIEDEEDEENYWHLNLTFIEEYEMQNLPIPNSFMVPIFTNFNIKGYEFLDILVKDYINEGLVQLKDSFSTVTNVFHLKIPLLMIILLPILTNLFLEKKNHILFQSSLKADLNKIYRKSFFAGFSSSWFLYIGLLGLMFLVSGLIFGFENGNYPYAITFAEDFTFMNTRKLIILNILLSSFALFFLQSLVTGLSLVFERKRAIRLYGVLVVLGIVGSFLTKFSYLSPFSYLDSQGVITGLLRTFHGENKFTLLLGVVLLFLVSILIHYFNIRQIKKDLLLKLKS